MPKQSGFLKTRPDQQLSKHLRKFISHGCLNIVEAINYCFIINTSVEGLIGIIKNRSLWFTHTNTLNDPSELKYGKVLVQSLLGDELDQQHDQNIKDFIKALIDEINAFAEGMYETYVACFCESDKLLSQWRAYAASGGGYNLGFEFTSETKFFHALNDKKERYISLRKVIYNVDEQKRLISDYLSIIIKYVNSAIQLDGVQEKWKSWAAMESASIFFELMFSFKDQSFKEEQEWRLIKTRQAEHEVNQLHFRGQENRLIPYIDTYIFEKKQGQTFFPLRSIRYGPMLDDSSTKKAIDLLIGKESGSDCDIKIDPEEISVDGAGYSLR